MFYNLQTNTCYLGDLQPGGREATTEEIAAQVRVRGNGANNYILSSKGWIDSRGRDA